MSGGDSRILEPAVFPLPGQDAARRVLASLESRFVLRREPAPVRRMVYLDTFDWRLHQAGMSLFSSAANGASRLRLECPRGPLECRMPNGALPAFAADLPASLLQARVAPLIEVRRLLPLATLESTDDSVSVLDAREKTVARIYLEQTVVVPPEDREAGGEPAPILRVVPMRGYAGAMARVREHISAELGLTPTAWRRFARELLSRHGRPGDTGAKPSVTLAPDMHAGRALARVCLELLDTIEANEDGVRRDLDVEFLHDFRVAIRCTRSALAQLKKVFPAEARKHFRAEFKWLAAATGELRDMDVYLQKMDRYRDSLPGDTARDLVMLEKYLRRQRGAARRRLLAALRSRRYRRLLESWRRFLDDHEDSGDSSPRAARPVLEVASRRIWRAYRRVRRDGARIGKSSPADTLHNLRIDGKKLRYLLVFFSSLYDRKDVRPLIKSLKRLQDNLGDFNDLAVQQRILQRFARDMQAEGAASADCLLAMGRLLEHLHDEQARERQRFDERFAQFSSTGNDARFRRLFHEGASRRGPEPA